MASRDVNLLTIFSRASHEAASKNAKFLNDFKVAGVKSSYAVVLARSSHEFIHALLTKPSSAGSVLALELRGSQSVSPDPSSHEFIHALLTKIRVRQKRP